MIYSTDKKHVSLRYVARAFPVQTNTAIHQNKTQNLSGSPLPDFLTRSRAAICAGH